MVYQIYMYSSFIVLFKWILKHVVNVCNINWKNPYCFKWRMVCNLRECLVLHLWEQCEQEKRGSFPQSNFWWYCRVLKFLYLLPHIHPYIPQSEIISYVIKSQNKVLIFKNDFDISDYQIIEILTYWVYGLSKSSLRSNIIDFKRYTK